MTLFSMSTDCINVYCVLYLKKQDYQWKSRETNSSTCDEELFRKIWAESVGSDGNLDLFLTWIMGTSSDFGTNVYSLYVRYTALPNNLQALAYKSSAYLQTNVNIHTKITLMKIWIIPHFCCWEDKRMHTGWFAYNYVKDLNNLNIRWNIKAKLEHTQDVLSMWDKFIL